MLSKMNRLKGDNTMEKKKLHKSASNQVLAGVCGGIGEYLDIDPTIIRLIWAGFTILGGSGLLAYIVAALVIPAE